MSVTKTQRPKKRQLGQFMTPLPLARRVLDGITFEKTHRVLEPSMGDGSFVVALIEKFLSLYNGPLEQRLEHILKRNIYGLELDPELYASCLSRIEHIWGYLPSNHNFVKGDFFLSHFTTQGCETGIHPSARSQQLRFDYIIGNPPFGGTIKPSKQDQLDRLYGFRNGHKIKKETYSFFIVKSLDMLTQAGEILFLCSDTFLTINTMRGLRLLLMTEGNIHLTDLETFSDETSQRIVLFKFTKNGFADGINVNTQYVSRKQIELTKNFSWRITEDMAKYFDGPILGDFMVGSSGMTVGKNEYFLRKIDKGRIIERYKFEFYQEPITLAKEIQKARLNLMSETKMAKIRDLEASGETRRNVRVLRRARPLEIQLPHPDYCYYNKAVNAIIYSPPTHVIFWKDDGDAVLTFKKSGNWYLHGVGGQHYFKREGLTWQLIANKLRTRYLPPGYILDSGAPCAFLRQGISKDELLFILAWTLTPLCTYLLKEVINHTMNIQSKDFERLPYPFWIPQNVKERVLKIMKSIS